MQSPPSSAFADVITSLAGLHQEQHQDQLSWRNDQERHLEAILQGQQEDCEGWAASSVPQPPPTNMLLTKIGQQDDPEAFLDLFEKATDTSGWPAVYETRTSTGGASAGGWPATAHPEHPGFQRVE